MSCAAPAFAQARNDPDDPKNPYPEEQNPTAARGRELADFARSLRIKRGTPYVKRPEGELTLDIYEPRSRPSAPLPCVLAFGLSGFRINQTNYRWDLEKLLPSPTANLYPPALARGRVVVVANLRVAAQAMWPAQIHDAKCAIRWVRKNASTLRIDPKRIGFFGASASGNLCALLALTAAKGELDDASCDPKIATDAKAVCCIAAPLDWIFYKESDPGDKSLFGNIMSPYLGNDDKFYREASPIQYIHKGAPPFLLLHGLQDYRVPYSQMTHFAEALNRNGTVETVAIDNFQHGPMPGKEPDPGYAVLDRKIYGFFDRYLG